MNSIKITCMGTLSVSCLMAASTALATDDADGRRPHGRHAMLLERFDLIDADGDGVLSREEIEAFVDADRPFGQARGPGDRAGIRRGQRGFHGRGHGAHDRAEGIFRRLEYLESEIPPAGFSLERFPEADANEDGELSEGEWTTFAAAARERLLERMAQRMPVVDTDADGTVSESELEAFRTERRARLRERILSGHPEADTDEDGVLSDEEFEAFEATRTENRRARLLERHPDADLDGDGVLSDEELESFQPPHRGERSGGQRGHRGHRTPGPRGRRF